MKIFASTPCGGESFSYYMIADSAFTPWRRPLFLPDWDADFRLYFSPLVVINRLGKSIPARFAGRYYSQAAWGWTVRAGALYAELVQKGLPVTAAVSFDCAAFSGDKTDFGIIAAMLRDGVAVAVNGERKMVCSCGSFASVADQCIEMLSRHDTLKTGDILYPLIPAEGIVIKEGDKIEISDCTSKVIHKFIVK